MPTLILARHAKAEGPTPGLTDDARPLALIGRKAAARLGEVIAEAGYNPDLALVSPAVRTQQTWKLMEASLAPTSASTIDALYETHVQGVLAELAELGDVETVIVVGHEPTSSATAAFLAGKGSDTPALKRIAHGIQTGTAAVLEFEGEWDSLKARSARLLTVLSGRDVEVP
ncbi:SixA phosphatase family protein [Demequina pelophila]|uniref:SixA phosphatase family protein n=1 Tax=Demequina pelophila TaxID=1638984 RepID=UPI000785B234|nr:histidine phosphatase family protein [Demequina pelophila]